MAKPHPSAGPQSDHEMLLDEIIAEVSERMRCSESIDIEQYADKHPEIADQLRHLYPAMQAMANLGFEPEATLSPAAANAPDESEQYGTLGDFRLLREIGRGGMGVVYEARQISLSRNVALKILPFASMLDDRHIQRFKTEALAAAQLDHPHIVDVYGVGCERSVHYYAMRYVEGTTLAEVIHELRDKQPLKDGKAVPSHREEDQPTQAGPAGVRANDARPHPPPQAHIDTGALAAISTILSGDSRRFIHAAARIGIEVAEALDHAHENGVIHRDIKPGNILLDHKAKTWVTDFGLARLETNASMTMTGDLLGTVRYMSPEQAMAKRVIVDHRTDIYSLGVTLYELVTLQPAFPDTDRQELMRKIAFEEPTPPRKLNRAIPEELETIILKASAKNPAERYATAADLAEDLRCFLDNKPIQARRPNLLQRLSKWSQRHRAAVFTTGLIASLLLSFGIILLAVSNRMISQERDAKDDALAEATENLETAERETARAERAEALARERLEDEQDARQQVSTERDKAVQAEKAAESRFQLATEAVERYLEEVANDPELQAGNFHELRKRLLESAMPFYEKLIAEKPQDQNQRIARGKAFEGLWRLEHYYFSDYDAGLSHAKQAFEVFEQLAEETPDDGESRRHLASSHTVMGIALQSAGGERQDARQHFEQAIEIAQTLVKEFPDEVKFKSLLANTTGNWANYVGSEQEREQLREKSVILYEQLSDKFPKEPKHRDMLAFYLNNSADLPKLQRALEIREQLHRDYPHVTKYRDRVAVSFRTIAARYSKDGQWDQAREHYEKALELRAALAREFAVPNHKYELAQIHRGLGLVFQDTSKPEQAREHYQQASQLLESLVTELKDVKQFRELAVRVHCDLGKDRYREGKWQAALESIERADQLRDGEINWHRFVMAMAHWQLGDMEEARTVYWDAVRMTAVGNDNDELQGFRTEADQLLGISSEERVAFEVDHLTKLIVEDPNHVRALRGRAEIYRNMKQWEKAIDDYSNIIRLNAHDANAYRDRYTCYREIGEYDSALADITRAIELNPDNEWFYDKRATLRIYLLGQFQEGLTDCNQALRINPQNRNALLHRAVAHNGLEQHEAAVRDAVDVIKLDPNYPWGWSELTKFVRATQNPTELAALDQLPKYLEKDAEAFAQRAESLANKFLIRAKLYADNGDSEQVLADCERAFGLLGAKTPGNGTTLKTFLTVLVELKQWDRALEVCTRAIESGADEPQSWVFERRGRVHARKGDPGQAVADFSEAIRLDPRWYYYHSRAVARAELGQWEKAIEDNLEAVRLSKRSPDDPHFAETGVCAHILYRAGRYEEALEKMKPHGEGTVWDWLWLAMIHHRLGHVDEARQSLDKANRWMREQRPNNLGLLILYDEADECVTTTQASNNNVN